MATAAGWDWVHFRSERTRPRQSPVITGTLRKGWPDLLLVKAGYTPMAVELKRDGGEPTEDQLRVLRILAGGGFAAYVWLPEDRETVRSMLNFGGLHSGAAGV